MNTQPLLQSTTQNTNVDLEVGLHVCEAATVAQVRGVFHGCHEASEVLGRWAGCLGRESAVGSSLPPGSAVQHTGSSVRQALVILSLYTAVNLTCHCFRWEIKSIEIIEVAQ